MTRVKSYTKKVNGKTINVKSYERKEPILSAREYLEKSKIKQLKTSKDIWNDNTIKKELLGKGKFTKYYKKGDKYFIETTDITKELYTPFFRGDSKYKHFPNLDYSLETTPKYNSKGELLKVYEVKNYHNLTKKEYPEQFKIMRNIQKELNFSKNISINFSTPSELISQNVLNKFIERIEKTNLFIPKDVKSELLKVTTDSTNYENINLEISPRNVKVDDKNNLILNDIFFKMD